MVGRSDILGTTDSNRTFRGPTSDLSSRLGICGIAVDEIARTYGTPLYVIAGLGLTNHLVHVAQIFANTPIRLLYSVKANPNLDVMRACLAAGFGLDACSAGDVALARAAGAPPESISYTGVGLSRREIGVLLGSQIHVNLDSAEEIRSLIAVAPGRRLGIRVAPGIEAGFHPHCRAGHWGGKFGVDPSELPALLAALADARCEVTTLHVHIGSSISSPEPFLRALDTLLELASRMPMIAAVNLGGGLAARYHPEDAAFDLEALRDGIVDRLRSFAAMTGRQLEVLLEPGEFLVSESEYLLSRILVTKQWARAKTTIDVAICDASMNLMPAHSLYGTYFHLYVDGARATGAVSHYDVYGCTNQAGDSLALARELPMLSASDLIVIRNAGAYAYSRSTQFNQRPRPAEVWVENGTIRVSRQAETVAMLLEGQRNEIH